MKVLPRRRRAVLINSVLGVAVLAGAGGAYAAVTGDSGSPARSGARTVAVAKGTVLATVSGSGSLSSPSDAAVNFSTGGRLTEVDVKPGDKVTKGQLLGKVDATAATETLAQSRAALTAAQANVTKAEAGQLSSAPSNGSSSSRGGSAVASAPAATPTVDPAQVAQARAQLTQAQNAVDAAQRAVDGTVLKAPAAGTVASVTAKAGDTVSGTSGGGSGGSVGGNGGSGGNSASSSAGSSSSSPVSWCSPTRPACRSRRTSRRPTLSS